MIVKPISEGERRRLRAFKHNGLRGGVGMAKANMHAIVHADSTTPAAKELAEQIWDPLVRLRAELRTRVDPKP